MITRRVRASAARLSIRSTGTRSSPRRKSCSIPSSILLLQPIAYQCTRALERSSTDTSSDTCTAWGTLHLPFKCFLASIPLRQRSLPFRPLNCDHIICSRQFVIIALSLLDPFSQFRSAVYNFLLRCSNGLTDHLARLSSIGPQRALRQHWGTEHLHVRTGGYVHLRYAVSHKIHHGAGGVRQPL
jgi:hypothetical protein